MDDASKPPPKSAIPLHARQKQISTTQNSRCVQCCEENLSALFPHIIISHRREVRFNAPSASSRASCSFVRAISVALATPTNLAKEVRSSPKAMAASAQLRTKLSFRLAMSLPKRVPGRFYVVVFVCDARELAGNEHSSHVGPAADTETFLYNGKTLARCVSACPRQTFSKQELAPTTI